ncbi:MAG: hypothetical protein WAX69_19730 [Victivallales bacterium]
MKKKTVPNQKNGAHKADARPDFAKMELSMIMARLSLPMEKRTGFLRRRLPGGGSCL